MKKLLTVLIIWLTNSCYAQNVGISASSFTPDASAMLDVSATDKGVLVPRLALVATNSVNPITSPTVSLLVYNTASASSGSTAVSPGFYYWDGSKWVAISGGTGGKDWALLGNAGTVDGTNFLGTTDAIPLNFKVNNQKAGRIDHVLFNSFYGYQSPNTVPTGSFNVANGALALSSLTSGSANVASGYQALSSLTSGSNNVATGHQALSALTTGSANVANGHQTLNSLTTGSNNVAIGYQALKVNNGNANTALGFQALVASNSASNVAIGYQTAKSNTSGSNNTAIGALTFTTNLSGIQNVAVGSLALNKNSSGNSNIAIGHQALLNNTASSNIGIGLGALLTTAGGGFNTAVGNLAGSSNSTGTNNTYLGASADGPSGITNASAIGYGATTYTSNTIELGNSSVLAVISSGNNVRRNPNQIAINASATAAASDIINGYITSTSAAAVNITLPSITLIATQLGGTPVRGTTIDFTVDNSAGANSITLVLDASITTATTPAMTGGNNLVVTTANSIGMFRLVFTSGTAAKIFRVY